MTLIKSISGIRGIIDKSLDCTMVAKYVQAFSNISPHGKILLARDTRNSGKDYIQTAIIALKQINRETRAGAAQFALALTSTLSTKTTNKTGIEK